MAIPFGPLDEPLKLGPTEFGGDDSLGWTGDLGVAKGRELTAAERSLLRMPPPDNESGIDERTGLPIPDAG